MPSARISVEPALEDALLELELGNAVAQQAADAIGSLEDGDLVARTVQLIGCGEARRPGSDHRDALARAPPRRRVRRDPAFFERALDDRDLDGLDRDRSRC